MTNVLGVSIVLGLMMVWVREVMPQAPNRVTYTYCGDKWDCRYPWLVEVRFSKDRTFHYFNNHKGRHGILITNSAVLTRAHDMEGYPVPRKSANQPGDMIPLAQHYSTCNEHAKACLYVNLRRPQREYFVEGPYCGHNIIVKQVVTHPKFGPTADIWKLFKRNDNFKNYKQFMTNMKYPFAIVVLVEPVNTTDPRQPYVPTAILPRTPLDFLYLLRRVDTLGPTSKLCEYPTYDGIKYSGWYSRYSRPKETVVKLRDREHRVYSSILCPDDTGLRQKGYEGSKSPITSYSRDREVQGVCNKSLLEGVLPYTFLAWKGPFGTLDEHGWYDGVPFDRTQASNDRLGAPIVCDGILIGITSTWHNRGKGTGLWDLYIGTTLMRVFRWLIRMMATYNDRTYHRGSSDSPFFGEFYSIKSKVTYRRRDYEKSMFELSLNEPIQPFGGSQTIKISLFGISTSSIILRVFV